MRTIKKIKGALKGAGHKQDDSSGGTSEVPVVRASIDKDTIGPRILHEGKDAIVDIIFLHGLIGSRDRTWSATEAGDPWPLLLLSEDLPNARLITYGYDADVVHWTRPAGQATIREHSRNLVQDLGNIRRAPPETTARPIILVAHSLGGLVCEDAIFFCTNTLTNSQEDFLASVVGVVFFGTPHAGAELTKFATALSSIISLSQIKKPNRAPLDVLKRTSEMLSNIENDFFAYIRKRLQSGAKPIDLFAFVEEKPLAAIGKRVVEPDSAVIKGYAYGTIHADHVRMTKFAMRDSQYNRVLGLLRDWVTSIEKAQVSQIDKAPNDPFLGSEKYFKYPSVGKFHVKRPKLRSRVEEALSRKEDGRPTIVVLEGQGGQGKTQLAIEHCHHSYVARSRFKAIFWVDASSEVALQKSLITISGTVKSRGHIFNDDAARIRYTLDKFRSWNRDWLLVLDNFDKPKEFSNLESDYIPASAYCSVLVTSRHRNLHELGTVIPIPPMDSKEASKLLLDVSNFRDEGTASSGREKFAVSIIESLGHLPLAIHQAGAFIRRRKLPLAKFIEEYETRKAIIWRERPAIWSYNGTVYTTWELSFDQIDSDAGRRLERGAILTMLAFLDFRRVSSEIFLIPRLTDTESRAAGDANGPWPDFLLNKSGNWDSSRVQELVTDLHELCLLSATTNSKRGTLVISLHPLVAEWIKYRTTVTSEKKLEYLTHAFWLVKACLKVMGEGKASRWISQETQEEILKHEAACHRSRGELALLVQDAEVVARIEALAGEFLEPDARNPISNEDSMGHLNTGVHRRRNNRLVQAHTNILDWLSSNLSEQTHMLHSEQRLSGTCDWIFETRAYRHWINSGESVLAYLGPPGSGKSLMASRVIDELPSRDYDGDDKTAVTFFYFSYKYGGGTTVDFIGSIIRQLVTRLKMMPARIVAWYEKSQIAFHGTDSQEKISPPLESTYRDSRPELDEAILVLESFAEEFSTIFIIIDALDETGGEDRRQIIRAIEQLVQRPGHFKFFITTRPLPEISGTMARLGLLIEMPGHSTEIARDIREFVTNSLSSDSRFNRMLDSELEEEIIGTIFNQSGGMFLAVHLLLDSLRSAVTKTELLDKLRSLPSSLDATYEKAMQNAISKSNLRTRNLILTALAWLLRAQRPLTIRELAFALTYDEARDGFQSDLLISEEDIVSSCADLVRVDPETRIVSFIHLTVRQFLESERSDSQWTLSLSHAKISNVCMSCLKYATDGRTSIADKATLFPLLEYSATHWATHARAQEEPMAISRYLRDESWRIAWFTVLRFNQTNFLSSPGGDFPIATLVKMRDNQIAAAFGLDNTAAFLA